MNQNQFNSSQLDAEKSSMPKWMVFLMFLAYLKAMQPAPSTTLLVAFIRAITAILITLIIAQQGGTEVIANILSHLP